MIFVAIIIAICMPCVIGYILHKTVMGVRAELKSEIWRYHEITRKWSYETDKNLLNLADKLGYEWKEESKEAGFVKKDGIKTLTFTGVMINDCVGDLKDKDSKSTKKAKK